MSLVNLTPHVVRVVLSDGNTLEIPPSGKVARVAVSQEVVSSADGVPIVRNRYGAVEGVPEGQTPGAFYIVSGLVLSRVNRPDVLAPDTGPTALRENGQIVAVTRFVGGSWYEEQGH